MDNGARLLCPKLPAVALGMPWIWLVPSYIWVIFYLSGANLASYLENRG